MGADMRHGESLGRVCAAASDCPLGEGGIREWDWKTGEMRQKGKATRGKSKPMDGTVAVGSIRSMGGVQHA
jgi:hypothetical protein